MLLRCMHAISQASSASVMQRPLRQFHSWRFTPLMIRRSPLSHMILFFSSIVLKPMGCGTTSTTSPFWSSSRTSSVYRFG